MVEMEFRIAKRLINEKISSIMQLNKKGSPWLPNMTHKASETIQ